MSDRASRVRGVRVVLVLLGLWWAGGALAQAHGEGQAAATPTGAVETRDPAERSQALWARPGLLLNPVAISFDGGGNVYVAEGWRRRQSQVDTRKQPVIQAGGLDDDLRMQSVDERAAQIERWIADGVYPRGHFTADSDQVRLVRDTDHDGVADASTVFAGGFNTPVSGLGAGVLYLDGRVYYTCIPDLWLLEDRDRDGKASADTPGERTSLAYGFGVRWAFTGHDMHGLTLGPDGRIYFSIADRGFNVTTREGNQLFGPDQGAVFRVWPDGRGLELFCTGMRNPQELAFDNYGNLFTGENNCDAGDRARFDLLVEGGDYGWRQDFQQMPGRGAWMREGMWKTPLAPDDPAQPKWTVPTIAYVGKGPSGIAHYPGTGDSLPSNGSFLLADFPGDVRRVDVVPDGAWFRVVHDSSFLSGKNISDVAFGYDGRAYLSDWGTGWSPNPDGHIVTVTNDKVHADPAEAAAIREVQTLFARGFAHRPTHELIGLLGHRDQRVRLAAQYELVKHDNVTGPLDTLMQDPDAPQLARIHALWALSVLARQDDAVADRIAAMLGDADDQVRTQAIKLLGDLRYPAEEAYLAALEDPFPQARFYAALALGKTGVERARRPLLRMLDGNAGGDPILMHGGSYALSLLGDAAALVAADHQASGDDASTPHTRLGVVHALRRLDSPMLAAYIDDASAVVAVEAARAIYDRRVMDAMPALAAMLGPDMPDALMIEPVLRRAIEANARLRGTDAAERLAAFAASDRVPTDWRVLALSELGGWSESRNREPVFGKWWPREPGERAVAVAALEPVIAAIGGSDNAGLARQALAIRVRYLSGYDLAALQAIALDGGRDDAVREAAMQRLVEEHPGRAGDTLSAVTDERRNPGPLRSAARELLGQVNREQATASYLAALDDGSTPEQQAAIIRLAESDAARARRAIADLANRLQRGELDPALRLEVYEAAQHSDDLNTRAAAMRYARAHRIGEGPWLADALLAGGSPQRGGVVFREHPAAECIRCHGRIGQGGLVGPDLQHIGSRFGPAYLYRALANPSADIADGYASVTLTLADGNTATGRVQAQTPDTIELVNADGEVKPYPAADVTAMTRAPQSLMTPMTDRLTAHQARDLIAYLVSVQDPAFGPAPASAGLSPATANPATGPTRSIINAAKGLNHAAWLPGILLAITAGLGALLAVTVFAGRTS